MFEESPADEDEVIREIVDRRTTAYGIDRHIRGTLQYVRSSVTKWIRRGMRKI
jgi:hypothetical protein